MTDKRDLKRRVRDRQAHTGEAYVTARRQVLAQAPRTTAIPVLEMVDLTELGRARGFTCRINLAPRLAAKLDPAAALDRLHDVLLATEYDGGLWVMRNAVLLGARLRRKLTSALVEDMQRFMLRARAGLGGVSQSGHMVALHVAGRAGGVMVIYSLTLPADFVAVAHEPSLSLVDVDWWRDTVFDVPGLDPLREVLP